MRAVSASLNELRLEIGPDAGRQSRLGHPLEAFKTCRGPKNCVKQHKGKKIREGDLVVGR